MTSARSVTHSRDFAFPVQLVRYHTWSAGCLISLRYRTFSIFWSGTLTERLSRFDTPRLFHSSPGFLLRARAS